MRRIGGFSSKHDFPIKTTVRRPDNCEEKANILTLILQKLYKTP